MNISVKIEKATTNDLEIIYEIERDSYAEPWPKEMLVMDYLFNGKSEYYVARWMNQVVGFITMWNEGEKLHIVNIAVSSKHRKKGVGKKLLQFAIKHAKKTHKTEIYLEVRKSNEVAQKLYRSLGFLKTGEIKNYYNNGEDGYIMRRKINEYIGN